jgi:hypothetical protein
MSAYVFSFPAAAENLAVTVRDAAGEVVATGTVGESNGLQGPSLFTAALAGGGSYEAVAGDVPTQQEFRASGELDIEVSVLQLIAGGYGEFDVFGDDGLTAVLAVGTHPAGSYTVSWGDGDSDTDSTPNGLEHVYAEAGEYVVTMTGPAGYHAACVADVPASGAWEFAGVIS